MKPWLAISCLALAGCDLPPSDPARVADQCEARARAAQAPTSEVTIGVNSSTGGFASGAIGITSDFLRRRDPVEVYESCVFTRTGEPPIRPPVLRAL